MVVTNTGPLIALAKIGQLTLLRKLFANVMIPPAVNRELSAKTGPETSHLDEALGNYIIVTTKPEFPAEVQLATAQLGIGEQQAIALAYQQQALLIIDERLGREAARQLGVSLSGSVGFLILAKENDLIPAVRPLLDDFRRHGYWLSDELLVTATRLAGEKEG
jgi:predicted nucleic acid-binding protein